LLQYREDLALRITFFNLQGDECFLDLPDEAPLEPTLSRKSWRASCWVIVLRPAFASSRTSPE
jgi:hypothetical protein